MRCVLHHSPHRWMVILLRGEEVLKRRPYSGLQKQGSGHLRCSRSGSSICRSFGSSPFIGVGPSKRRADHLTPSTRCLFFVGFSSPTAALLERRLFLSASWCVCCWPPESRIKLYLKLQARGHNDSIVIVSKAFSVQRPLLVATHCGLEGAERTLSIE